jgi:hypothetical protein
VERQRQSVVLDKLLRCLLIGQAYIVWLVFCGIVNEQRMNRMKWYQAVTRLPTRQ